MATLKYSRQRASIKEYLMNTKEHPTADMVYLHVRKQFPHISLGTVYRNLNLLAETGEAKKITTPDGGDRFDGCTEPHYHIVCNTCGEVFDLELGEEYFNHLNLLAGQNFDGTIDSHTALFTGTCPQCLIHKKNESESKTEKIVINN